MTDPAEGFVHLDDREVHSGRIWSVVVGQFTSPGGVITRDIVRSPGSVGVLPVLFDPEGVPSVVLVEQYRPALDRAVIEIPAGMRDVPGEDPAATAARELTEEVGMVATRLEHLTTFSPSPGMTDATTMVFLALDCTNTQRAAQGPEEEAMITHHLPLADALGLVESGAIHDAKTVIALLMLERRLAYA